MKIIPIFIPHAGCPYKCIYCDQHRISGAARMPDPEEIHSIVERNLTSIPEKEEKEIAFFGGTFTSLPGKLQEKYLDAVYPYIKKGAIKNIRISTHPETVTLKSMRRFKNKGGRLVELGIQSLEGSVLREIKREVSLNAVKKATRHIKKAGLKLGVQVMLGLPGDNLEKSIRTAKKLIKLNPETARIYPVLVLKGTELGRRFKENKYRPLSLNEAIEQGAIISDIFESSGVKVIRIGLHPSKDLDSKKTVLAGPYHPAFGEMVRARQMRNGIIGAIKDKQVANRSRIEIYAHKSIFNVISGHKCAEKIFLEEEFGVPVVLHVKDCSRLRSNNNSALGGSRRLNITIKDIRRNIAIIDPRMPEEAKDKLRKLNYYIKEVPLYERLSKPLRGHVDMLLFRYKNKVIYEPHLKEEARLLRRNGYDCIEGDAISSSIYPKDIIYNACAIDACLIRYKGNVEKGIRSLKTKHILVSQGYVKCSIVPVDKKHIITSDKNIKKAWERNDGVALLIRPGYVKLPGYKAGFLGGASGVDDKVVFFVGSLKHHPDRDAIMDFIKARNKGIVELYDGPLYDVGTVTLFECSRQNLAHQVCEVSPRTGYLKS